MAYQNNRHKFVAVLNRSHALPVLMNALAHLSYGLHEGRAARAGLLPYPCPACGFEARISKFPFIILQTHNSGQLRTLLDRTRETGGLDCNVFSSSMLGESAEAQQAATARATPQTLDLIGIVLHGASEQVDPLTRKFSLFKS